MLLALPANLCRHSSHPRFCSSVSSRRAGPDEVGCDDRRRFELELEFLHCLANPGYLNCELSACAPALVLPGMPFGSHNLSVDEHATPIPAL